MSSLSINIRDVSIIVFIGSEFDLETNLSLIFREGIYDFSTVKLKSNEKHDLGYFSFS